MNIDRSFIREKSRFWQASLITLACFVIYPFIAYGPSRVAPGSALFGQHPLVDIVVSVTSIGTLLTAIDGLRENHKGEVYFTWYMFSLNFVILVLAYTCFYHYNLMHINTFLELNLSCSEDDTFCRTTVFLLLKALVDFSGDIRDQFISSAALLAVIVAPQVLSFLLSGLSKCATRPILIETSTRWTVLAFCHALGAFSALEMVNVIFGFLTGENGFVTATHFASSLEFCAADFYFSLAYYVGYQQMRWPRLLPQSVENYMRGNE